VIYQARPFISKSQLEYDMKRIGAMTWKAILVNNPTKRSAVPNRAAKARTFRSRKPD
jgi:hypothetical protein